MLTVSQNDELKNYIENVLKKNFNDFHQYEIGFRALSGPVQKFIIFKKFLVEIQGLVQLGNIPNILLGGNGIDNELSKIKEKQLDIFNDNVIEFYFGPTKPTFKQRLQMHMFDSQIDEYAKKNNVFFEKGELTLNIKEHFAALKEMYLNDENRAVFLKPEDRAVAREKMFYSNENNTIVCVYDFINKMKVYSSVMRTERNTNLRELLNVVYDMSDSYMEEFAKYIVDTIGNTSNINKAEQNDKEDILAKKLELLWSLSNEFENIESISVDNEVNKKQEKIFTILGNKIRGLEEDERDKLIYSLLLIFNKSMTNRWGRFSKPSKYLVSFFNEFVNYQNLENQYFVFGQKQIDQEGNETYYTLKNENLKNIEIFDKVNSDNSIWITFDFNYLAIAKAVLLDASGVIPSVEDKIAYRLFNKGAGEEEDKISLVSYVHERKEVSREPVKDFAELKSLKEKMYMFMFFIQKAMKELGSDFETKAVHVENNNRSVLAFKVESQENFNTIQDFIIKVLELNVESDEIFKAMLIPVIDEYLMTRDILNNRVELKSSHSVKKLKF